MNQINNNSQLILSELTDGMSLSTSVRQKRRICSKGESDFDIENYFYFIIRGKIKISQINFETNKEQTLYLLSDDDMFDVTTLLDNQAYECLIEVLEESEVIEVPIAGVRELLQKEPAFQRFFFPYIAKQLRNMEELAVDLSLHSVYQRLVRLFIRNVDKETINPKLKRINTLSHDELASMVGSVRKVVNRALQQLKEEGVINISRKKLELTNIKNLLKKLNF